jgi:hypothetical protein
MYSNACWQRSSALGRTMVVSLLLLLAGPVSAQPAYAPEAAGTEAPSAKPERKSQGARIGYELGFGALTSLGLGLAGTLAGGAFGALTCGQNSGAITSGLCPFQAAAVGAVAGLGLGIPIGVWWGGNRAGGNGAFMGAFLGFGLSVGLGGFAISQEQPAIGAMALLAMPLLTVAGYELTDTGPPDAVPTTVAPAVGLGAGGATFGLQGSF